MKEEETKERLRKLRSKDGTAQKMVTFRCDNENLAWLESQPNKGRAINNLIAAAQAAQKEREA